MLRRLELCVVYDMFPIPVATQGASLDSSSLEGQNVVIAI